MAWLRLDDGFVEHPKIIDLSSPAFRLHVCGLCYSARNLTDGVLVASSVRVVRALARASSRHTVELVEAGLWLEQDGDYLINDYLHYNSSAAAVKAAKRANATRQKRWRDTNRNPSTGSFSNADRNALYNTAPSHKELRPDALDLGLDVARETIRSVIEDSLKESA